MSVLWPPSVGQTSVDTPMCVMWLHTRLMVCTYMKWHQSTLIWSGLPWPLTTFWAIFTDLCVLSQMTRPGEKNSFIFLSFPINLPLYKISSPACRWHCSGPSCPHNKQGPGTSIITLSYKELKSPSQCNRFWKFISLNSAMTLTWPWYNVHC